MSSAKLLTGVATLDGVVWTGITLVAFSLSIASQKVSRGNPLANPVLVTTLLVGLCLLMSNHKVEEYQQQVGLIHWLLGPATVALALPMYTQWRKIRELGWRLVLTVVLAGIIAPISAWGVLFMFDTPTALQMTMLTKSITTPLAMDTSAKIQGVPALAAVFVIATGIVGAIVAPCLYALLNVTLPQAQGVALGTVCHAVGTAKALQMGERVGALATLGLCMNGVLTALLLPLLFA
ncbi:LrgB family protein [Aestuariibacter sp. A3R04]|nr:LrgB family protein [Aestuariibacter sp. A3R04]